MPLVETGRSITTIIKVECLCGTESVDYVAHYRHAVTDCPIYRCRGCLMVVRGGPITDDRFPMPENHECPGIELMKLKRGIQATNE